MLLDLFCYSLLLAPFAFFWCCCGCTDCGSKARSVLVTFGGTWANGGCAAALCTNCNLYQGSTYELSFVEQIVVGDDSSCRYEAPGECTNHVIRVVISRKFVAGVYDRTEIQASVDRVPSAGGCSGTAGTLTVTAASENPFDCDAPRTVNMVDGSGFPSSLYCDTTSATALVESP